MRLGSRALVVAAVVLAAGFASGSASERDGSSPIYVAQGDGWGTAERTSFYSMDQGSEIMPIAWARALFGPDGRPFLADALGRYGYLRNGAAELPVGFTAATRAGVVNLGMTCAACHTREIRAGGSTYRIDGAPALSDFQAFLQDLDSAVAAALASDDAFRGFAARALGASATPAAVASLRQQVDRWYRRQHTLFSRALPAESWGLGRLDAVSMILNRVSGLDIGPAPDFIIADNIRPADAPVRYPFIWDAPLQDRTQWPGFADNGDALLAMARNLGEVYGVFADFHPTATSGPIGHEFHSRNSANFSGLLHLEGLVRRIGAPRWPWPIDTAARDRGQAVFAANCASCHGVTRGATRLLPYSQTWKTPLVDAGTDTREYDVLARTGDTGVLAGARYSLGKRLLPVDSQFNMLAASVVGSLLDRYLHRPLPPEFLFGNLRARGPRPDISSARDELRGAYRVEAVAAAAGGARRYEARVLHGIWATAPYLHNGSVPSLAELLKRPEDRVASFALGREYDLSSVGLAQVQPGSQHVRHTTGCDRLNSGNSRCGHAYGTALRPDQKHDLVEYLKTY